MANQTYDQPIQYTVPITPGPGGGGADIPATKFARQVKIWENGVSNYNQGLVVTYPNGVQVTYDPTDYPIVLGNPSNNTEGSGGFLAMPAQDGADARAADIYCSVAGYGGPTTINVLEID